ncbi:MAG: arylesterase [Gammaproteobacteria bacterium]|jgi:acyl-CoA thioesterase-1|nr:arylesterase [Gammaproteobacteria bacterium]
MGAPTLLIVGDSLSAGYGLDRGQSWVDLLAADPKEILGTDGQILNASISGETTTGGLSRLPGLLERHQPDAVLIALGANDGLRGLPLTTMQANLKAMFQLATDAGAQVLYAGIELPRNYGGPFTRAFRRAQDQVAQETRVPYLPFFLEPVALNRELFQEDGLHPTAEAQSIIADYVGVFLQESLSK